jgi:hypothetical protein
MIRFNEQEKTSTQEEQLQFDIKISRFAQMRIRVLRFIREMFFSNVFLFLRRVLVWVNLGFLGCIVYLSQDIITGNIEEKLKVFVSPALYSAGIFSFSFLMLSQIQTLLIFFFIIFVIVLLVAYIAHVLHRGQIADAILIMLLVMNILVFKLIIQNLWLWNI